MHFRGWGMHPRIPSTKLILLLEIIRKVHLTLPQWWQDFFKMEEIQETTNQHYCYWHPETLKCSHLYSEKKKNARSSLSQREADWKPPASHTIGRKPMTKAKKGPSNFVWLYLQNGFSKSYSWSSRNKTENLQRVIFNNFANFPEFKEIILYYSIRWKPNGVATLGLNFRFLQVFLAKDSNRASVSSSVFGGHFQHLV